MPGPSTVDTTTNANATSYPFQRKTYYCVNNGYHYKFVYNGVNFYVYRSLNGLAPWTQGEVIWPAGTNGYVYSSWYDGIRFYFVRAVVGTEALTYKTGTPHADGTIAISGQSSITFLQFREGAVDVSNHYPGPYNISGNIYQLVYSSGGIDNYNTELIAPAVPTANEVYIFTPYGAAFDTGGIVWPPFACQNRGWRIATNNGHLYERRIKVNINLRCPLGTPAHNGTLGIRLWKDNDGAFGSPTAMCAWQTQAVALNPGDIVNINFNIDIDAVAGGNAMIVNDEVIYLEVGWQLSNPATANAHVDMEGAHGLSYINYPNRYVRYPTVSVDSAGQLWFGFTMDTGNSILRPYIATTTNPLDAINTVVYKMYDDLGALNTWKAIPIPLNTANRVLGIYCLGVATNYSRYWSGAAFGAEQQIGFAINLQGGGNYQCAVNRSDDVEFVFLNRVGGVYNIEHRRWTIAGGWVGVAQVHAAVSSISAPVLSRDDMTGNLYCFYATKIATGGLLADHVYYKKYDVALGAWDVAPTDVADETVDAIYGSDRLDCSHRSFNGIIHLTYMTKLASPWNVRNLWLNLSFTPTVPTGMMDGFGFVD